MDMVIIFVIGALIGFGVGFLIAYDLGLKESKRLAKEASSNSYDV